MGEDATGATGVRSPTVRRRELGSLLRALRTDAGLTVEQVAERLLCSTSKVSRMETGQRGASARDVRDLCDIYGIEDPVRREHLTTLAREGRGQAWWQPYDLPYATYIGLESEAISIADFEPGVFPGLLQTPAYARAVHEGTLTRLSPGAIDQQLEVRRTRQQILVRENPPRLAAVIDEAVLHRVVGGPSVMRAQLEHMVAVSKQSNITVQVLPYSIGAHPALDSTFILLELPSPVPGVVYVEGLVGQIYLERPQELKKYQQVFQRLTALSLSPAESVELMAKASLEYRAAE
ncbi:MAG TPA: helix-turn-helix transcriptional regulator [Streptosporangiaceae bacterium]